MKRLIDRVKKDAEIFEHIQILANIICKHDSDGFCSKEHGITQPIAEEIAYELILDEIVDLISHVSGEQIKNVLDERN